MITCLATSTTRRIAFLTVNSGKCCLRSLEPVAAQPYFTLAYSRAWTSGKEGAKFHGRVLYLTEVGNVFLWQRGNWGRQGEVYLSMCLHYQGSSAALATTQTGNILQYPECSHYPRHDRHSPGVPE
jgi:hypothetical protein